ncbi:MAG: PQQ-like beta-propeller repeat protein [Candidatus Omnitrophica bacterium]|nr:PQQ-like beta-propeller repeat protein [Candidatus Omnitrophota bacterium]
MLAENLLRNIVRKSLIANGAPGFFSFALAGFSLLTFMACAARANDWPRWRGPRVNGISTETGWSTNWPAEGPKVLWKAKIGVGFSTVSVSHGRLYTMGNSDETDHVYCFNAGTGADLWTYSYPCTAKDPNQKMGTRATPTVEANRVFTVSREGHLFCLNALDGKLIWAKHYVKDFGAKVPTWGFAGSPLVEGNLLIAEPGGPGASAVALDKATGKVIWQAGSDPAAYSSPVPFTYHNERCVVFLNVTGIVARRVSDGQELWRYPWKTDYDVNAATPIIERDKVFVSSDYNAGCVLVEFGSQPPKALWQNRNMRNHVNSCILWQGYLYGFDESQLKCLDWRTGEVKWAEKGPGKGSIMVADGKFIVYSDRGRVALADLSPAGYHELSGAQVLEGQETWAAPVLANGRLYCRSQDELVCLDVSAKSETASGK